MLPVCVQETKHNLTHLTKLRPGLYLTSRHALKVTTHQTYTSKLSGPSIRRIQVCKLSSLRIYEKSPCHPPLNYGAINTFWSRNQSKWSFQNSDESECLQICRGEDEINCNPPHMNNRSDVIEQFHLRRWWAGISLLFQESQSISSH